MLEIIKKLDSNTIRGLITVTIPLLVLIASFFGVDEALFGAKLQGIGEKIVSLVALLGVAWAAYGRLFQPAPPLTETAARATQEKLMQEEGSRQKDQGGFVHPGLLAVLATVLLTAAGCGLLGLQTSGGFNDRMAGGYSTVTALYEAISIRVDSQVRIAQMEPDVVRRAEMIAAVKDDAQNLKDQVDEAKEGLDVVQSLKGVNFEDAEERLSSTLKILEALQLYVEGKS